MAQDWEREQEQAIAAETSQSTATQDDPKAWRDPFYGFTDERPHVLKKILIDTLTLDTNGTGQ